MIIELSDFFNNPSLIEIGWLRIQYYAVTWVLSAIFYGSGYGARTTECLDSLSAIHAPVFVEHFLVLTAATDYCDSSKNQIIVECCGASNKF